jgi:predicted nucleic acid-binding protein
MKAIADTGFLVALASQRDAHHRWAKGISENITEPLLTCEAVLAETAFHVGVSFAIGFVENDLVRPAFQLSDHLPRIGELARRYQDRKPDLADLCLIRLSELHPKYPILTTDVTDFRIYRRGRREVIPILHP